MPYEEIVRAQHDYVDVGRDAMGWVGMGCAGSMRVSLDLITWIIFYMGLKVVLFSFHFHHFIANGVYCGGRRKNAFYDQHLVVCDFIVFG